MGHTHQEQQLKEHFLHNYLSVCTIKLVRNCASASWLTSDKTQKYGILRNRKVGTYLIDIFKSLLNLETFYLILGLILLTLKNQQSIPYFFTYSFLPLI